MNADFRDLLRALGVHIGARNAPPRRTPASSDLSLIGGQEVHTPLGTTWVIARRYPQEHPHGNRRLGPPASAPPILARWAGAPALSHLPPERILFLDTETSGLLNGAGTFVILVGVGWFEQGGFRLEQVFLRHPAEEQGLLAYLESLLARGAALVTYNGKAFDLPLLRTRYHIHNWQTAPTEALIHVDLLHLARRLWQAQLPNATLLSMETHILHVPRALDDIPGWQIPQRYSDYLRTQDAAPLQAVVYHNAMDVLSLAALYTQAVDVLRAPMEAPLHPTEHLARARLLTEQGRLDEAIRAYRAALAGPLSEDTRRDALLRLAALHKRRGEWQDAVTLWQRAAARGALAAFEELAKWHEHQRGNFAEALRWTEAALALLQAADYRAERFRWQGAFEHRRQRLQRRLGASS